MSLRDESLGADLDPGVDGLLAEVDLDLHRVAQFRVVPDVELVDAAPEAEKGFSQAIVAARATAMVIIRAIPAPGRNPIPRL